MPAFIPGLQLSRMFYEEAVRDILDRNFPDMPHSAALIGFGSDVIGFDNAMSTDHMWGPRMILLLQEDEYERLSPRVDAALREQLPVSFHGYSTHFGGADEIGVRLATFIEKGPVDHLIEISTLRQYVRNYTGWDPAEPLTVLDWLTFEEHKLLALTAGDVFHDDLGLNDLRSRLAYYPHEVWLYIMASQWANIAEMAPFVGRTGHVGDEAGSRILAASQMRLLMGLFFQQERRYAPYSKWFGSAFNRLPCAAELLPWMTRAFDATTWQEREAALNPIYEYAARRHNQLGLTPPLPDQVSPFYSRPYQVIHAELFTAALLAEIKDPQLCAIPVPIGSVNQFITSVDALTRPELVRKLMVLYESNNE